MNCANILMSLVTQVCVAMYMLIDVWF